MSELIAPLVSGIVLLPLAAAVVAARVRDESRARLIAICGAAGSLLLSLEILREVMGAGGASLAEPWALSLFRVDLLSAVPMALFAALVLLTLVVAPRRDMDSRFLVSALVLLSSTLAAYAADSLIVFFAAWIVSAAPFLRGRRIGGAILHTGLFPFHRSVIRAFESAPILLSALSMNSQLGAFLIARQGAPPWLSGLALFTSMYTALLGITERDPRRLLSIIMISQTSAIMAGLASGNPEAYTGALVQWIVVALASTVLIAIYRSVEARIGGNPGSLRFLGLAARMPRLAVFFAVSGFALIGLPGTLGFSGQHLMVYGVLTAHSWWGVALPIAIALNAYHVFILFTHLFLGKPVFERSGVVDAMPRERWALAAFVVLLIWGGLAPHRVVALRDLPAGAVHGESGSQRH